MKIFGSALLLSERFFHIIVIIIMDFTTRCLVTSKLEYVLECILCGKASASKRYIWVVVDSLAFE